MICRVIVRSGPAVGSGCVISDESPMTFGRLESNDCVLANDASISRQHFQIYFRNNVCWLKDLGSRNGTYVNECPIQSSQLNSGDEILVGSTRLVVRFTNNVEHQQSPPSSPNLPDRSSAKQGAIETLLAQKRTQLTQTAISEPFVRSKKFSKLLSELPGLVAIAPENCRLASLPGFEIERLAQGMAIFSMTFGTCEDLASEFIKDRRIFLISQNLTKSDFKDRLVGSGEFFVDPVRFWDSLGRMPLEILASRLEGINLVICRAVPPLFAGVYLSDRFEQPILSKLVKAG